MQHSGFRIVLNGSSCAPLGFFRTWNAVLGIAAGNGRASNRNYPGVAPDCDIIVVKLGTPDASGFPRTLELMQAIDYVSRKGAALGRPTAINLSFGNNYGGHDGESLLEQFIDQIAGIGRTAICVGTGNEAAAATHTGGLLKSGQTEDVYFSISPYETNLLSPALETVCRRYQHLTDNPNRDPGRTAGDKK